MNFREQVRLNLDKIRELKKQIKQNEENQKALYESLSTLERETRELSVSLQVILHKPYIELVVDTSSYLVIRSKKN